MPVGLHDRSDQLSKIRIEGKNLPYLIQPYRREARNENVDGENETIHGLERKLRAIVIAGDQHLLGGVD